MNSIKLPEYCTVFQAQIVATLKIVELIDPTIIVKQRLWRTDFKSKLSLECVNAIVLLSHTISAELYWFSGRSDILGNQRADSLFKERASLWFHLELQIQPFIQHQLHSYNEFALGEPIT